jgi:hypothetical protein
MTYYCQHCGIKVGIKVTLDTGTTGATSSGANAGIIAIAGQQRTPERTEIPDAFYKAFEGEESQ